MVSIIIYIGVIFFLGRGNYQKIEGLVFQKVINFTIGLVVFMYFFTEFKEILLSFKKEGINVLIKFYGNDVIVLSDKLIGYGIGGLYFLVCLFMSGLAFEMGAIKKRSRKLFVKSLPIVILVVSAYMYFYLRGAEQKIEKISLISGLAISAIIILIPIFIIYLSGWMKKIYE